MYQYRSLSLVRLLSMRMPRSSSFSVRDILDLPSLPKETDTNGNPLQEPCTVLDVLFNWQIVDRLAWICFQVIKPWRVWLWAQTECRPHRLGPLHRRSLLQLDRWVTGVKRDTVLHLGLLPIIQVKAGHFYPSKPLAGSSKKQAVPRLLYKVTTPTIPTMATSPTSSHCPTLSTGCQKSPLRRSWSTIVRTGLRRRKRGSR